MKKLALSISVLTFTFAWIYITASPISNQTVNSLNDDINNDGKFGNPHSETLNKNAKGIFGNQIEIIKLKNDSLILNRP